MFESGILGFSGGLIGVTAGILLSLFAEKMSYIYLKTNLLNAYFPLSMILGALLFSIFIGIVSGILPSINASRMNPVDALRYE